jgi:hypothetical protein
VQVLQLVVKVRGR